MSCWGTYVSTLIYTTREFPKNYITLLVCWIYPFFKHTRQPSTKIREYQNKSAGWLRYKYYISTDQFSDLQIHHFNLSIFLCTNSTNLSISIVVRNQKFLNKIIIRWKVEAWTFKELVRCSKCYIVKYFEGSNAVQTTSMCMRMQCNIWMKKTQILIAPHKERIDRTKKVPLAAKKSSARD